MRTKDSSVILKAVSGYETVGLDVENWLSNDLNIALTNEKEDVALFEHQDRLTNTVAGHYFFFSRGKEAVKAAQEFLQELFETTYLTTITGLTPLDNKGALWMNRRLGFKEYGQVDTEIGPCRFVVLTKEQWKDLNNE